MKKYTYQITHKGNKLYSGSQSDATMEDALQSVKNRLKIKKIQIGSFMVNALPDGRQVSVAMFDSREMV